MMNRKPNPRRFSYGGISTLHATAEQQTLLLIGEQERAGPCADVRIHDPIMLRESLSTLLEIISKGWRYSPSSPDVAAIAGESYEKWKTASPNLSPVVSRRKFHEFMESSDPDAWLAMDPVVTLSEDAIIFEVFDKRGREYASLTLRSDAFEGTIVPGTLHIEAGLELLESLALLHSRTELRLRIGAAAADGLDERHKGSLSKSFMFPVSWERQLLQMLAAATLPGRQVPMARVDIFNILRHLRLNREQKGQDKALRFALVPGEQPEITLEPWEWRYQCTGPVYEGAQSEIVGIWDRREPMDMRRLLPYVERAQVQILGEAQPTFWTLDCGSFSFTLATPGFRAMNWSKGLMMDIHLPRHTENPEGYEDFLSALGTGSSTLAALAESSGRSEESLHACLRRAAQNGQLVLDPGTGRFWKRSLFASVELDKLTFRNGQEGKAWRLVDQKRVSKQFTMRPTGEVDFVGPASDAHPGGQPSIVTEPKHPFQEREPRFTPKLELNRAGATRKPGCTCTYWKRQSASTKEACAHLQSLWLQHCVDLVDERRLEKEDPSRIKVRNGTFVKRRKDDEEIHEISLMYQRLTERWGSRQDLRDRKGRRQVMIFTSVDGARDAYFTRCGQLEQKGFLNASK